jgi:hypothetical protein
VVRGEAVQMGMNWMARAGWLLFLLCGMVARRDPWFQNSHQDEELALGYGIDLGPFHGPQAMNIILFSVLNFEDGFKRIIIITQ